MVEKRIWGVVPDRRERLWVGECERREHREYLEQGAGGVTVGELSWRQWNVGSDEWVLRVSFLLFFFLFRFC